MNRKHGVLLTLAPASDNPIEIDKIHTTIYEMMDSAKKLKYVKFKDFNVSFDKNWYFAVDVYEVRGFKRLSDFIIDYINDNWDSIKIKYSSYIKVS